MAQSDENGPKDDSAPRLPSEPGRDGPSIFHYQLREKIGEGSFGTVWKAERDGMFVALKELNKSLDSKETQDELKSLEALKKLHHKSLLKTENSWTEAGRLYIEMELADGGSLKDRLKAYKAMGKEGIPEDELLKFFTETAQAIDYLHRQTPVMLHRDIKPGNILLVKGCAKIADFGLLRQVTGDKSATRTQGGTLLYLAPESIANDMASVHTDLWSFAVTYVELRQGKLPFSGKSIGQIYDRIRWEPPELSEVFDPEEKKVILKALDKEPKNRHTSCYDFVFQLNRVVPWTPALKIPVMELATEPGAPTPMLRAGAPTGLTSKNNPAPTRTETDVRQLVGAGTPTPATDPRLDGTEKNTGPARTLHHAAPPTDTDLRAPKATAITAVRTGEPLPAPTPARRRRRAPVVGALFLAALIVGIAAVIWFIAHANVESEVRAQIEKKQFSQALERIDTANPLLLAATEELRAEVERSWWSDLTPPGDVDVDAQRKFLTNLEAFRNAFPNHGGIESRKAAGRGALREAVASKVDRLLELRDVAAAEDVVKSNEDDLDEGGRKLRLKIDNKQQVLAVLDHAELSLRRKNDFEGCMAELNQSKASFDSKLDASRRQTLLKQAMEGIKLRDSLDDKLVNELKTLAGDPKKLPEMQRKLENLLKIRKNYAKTDWKPTNVELAREYHPSLGVRVLLAAAWDALEGGDILKCRETIATVSDQLAKLPKSADFNPASYVKERSLLESLADVCEAKPAQRADAANSLSVQIREHGKSPPIAPRLWAIIVKLEKEKNYFTFKEVDELESAYSSLLPVDASIQGANSQLLAHVLERTDVKIRKDGWFPPKDERDRFVAWFGRVDAPLSDYLKALKAECLIEAGADAKTLAKIETPPLNDWYGRYVSALVEGTNSPVKAADALLEVLKAKPQLDAQRTARSATLLRSAVKSVRGSERNQWLDKKNALQAIPWLEALLNRTDLQAPPDEQEIDDLIDLASAAGTAQNAVILEKISKRIENARYDVAAKQKVHLGLARAYDRKGGSEESVVAHLVAALALKAPGKDRLRAEIDKEVKACAEHLHQKANGIPTTPLEERVALNSLCEQLMLKWRAAGLGDYLEIAADFYADAVYNRAFASLTPKFSTTASKRAEIYRVHRVALQGQKDEDGFFLPLTENKLKYADAKEDLDQAIPEGNDAIERGEKIAAVRQHKKDWWDLKMSLALVELGAAKERRIDIAVSTEKSIQDASDYRSRMLAVAAHYKRAVELKLYPKAWYLSYKLGAACGNCVGDPPGKDDAAIAKTAEEELTKARDALNKMSAVERQQNQRVFEDVTRRLKELKDKTGGG